MSWFGWTVVVIEGLGLVLVSLRVSDLNRELVRLRAQQGSEWRRP